MPKVRDGASKGKVERHFRTLKERWLYTLDISSITSLTQFNGMIRDYMRSYNTTFHRGINSTPMERFQASKDHPRRPQSVQWLDDCFYNRITRKSAKILPLPSTLSATMFPCSSSLQRWISAIFRMTWIPLTFCRMVRSSPSAGPTAMKTAIRKGTIFLVSIIPEPEVMPDVQLLLRTHLQSFRQTTAEGKGPLYFQELHRND